MRHFDLIEYEQAVRKAERAFRDKMYYQSKVEATKFMLAEGLGANTAGKQLLEDYVNTLAVTEVELQQVQSIISDYRKLLSPAVDQINKELQKEA